MYGAQALWYRNTKRHQFENDVEMYGAQAGIRVTFGKFSLRMM